MTIKEIREMLQLMEDHGLSELEVEREGMRIRLKKGGARGEPQVQLESVPSAGAAAIPAPTASAVPAKRVTINSPMVGTFYRAPAPDAPPFTDVGQPVEEGQVVCIIEAMKLMNEIKSDVRGRVADVLVGNGEPVEFGQPLFALEPA